MKLSLTDFRKAFYFGMVKFEAFLNMFKSKQLTWQQIYFQE